MIVSTPVVEAVGRGFYSNAIRLTTEFDLKAKAIFLKVFNHGQIVVGSKPLKITI